jgi:hypothetical protein
MKLQTEGYIPLGDLPNDERYPCLLCRCVPERVMTNVFVPEPKDIPSSVKLADGRTLVMPYRLCPQCFKVKADPWKIRLLMLERLNALAVRSAG